MVTASELGATPISARAVAPDLATPDRVVVILQMLLVDGRAYPLFVALLPAWTLGLGFELSLWQVAILGFGTWVAITLAAGLMGAAGYRGPAEVLLRRLSYGRRR